MPTVKLSAITALVSLALLSPARSSAARPGASSAAYLQTQCLLHAADPKNPWALAHGITGLGKSFATSEGTLAHEAMVSKYLGRSDRPDVGAFGFPTFLPDKTPADPHPNMIVKTLVLAGVSQSQAWTTPHGKVTLAELVESAKRSYRHAPQNPHYWEQVGWTLDLFSHVLTPARATFKDGSGTTVDFNAVMDDALTALESLDAELAAGMDRQEPVVPKRKQGIYTHSCGGLHLVQAVFGWARHPEVKKRWGKRLDRQIDVFFYRLHSERRQYDAALASAPKQYQLQILVQELKFYGHFLETAGRLEKERVKKLSKQQRVELVKTRALLDAAVEELKAKQAYETLDAIGASLPQVRLDLIGDGCHAVNGLALTERL